MSRIIRLALSLAFVSALVSSPFLISRASAGVVPGDGPCDAVQSVGLLDLMNLVGEIGQTSSSSDTMQTTVTAASVPKGPELSATEKVDIQNTLDALVSCINKRDPMRVLGLLSQHFQSLMVLDLLKGGDAMAVIAEQIPGIVQASDVTEPLVTPEIQKAWKQSATSTDVSAIVSMTIPGQADPVSFYFAFTPVGNTWKINEIAKYED